MDGSVVAGGAHRGEGLRYAGPEDDGASHDEYESERSVHLASPSAALKALLKQEVDDDGPVTGITLVDLRSICASPIGTTGLKSCRHPAQECHFRGHDTEDRRGRIDSPNEPLYAWVTKVKNNQGPAFLTEPVLLKSVADKVSDFHPFTTFEMVQVKWVECFNLIESAAAANAEEDAQYRKELLLMSMR